MIAAQALYSNAHCGSLPILGELRLSEGRVKLAEDSCPRVRVGPVGCHVRGLREGRVPRDLPEGGRPGIRPDHKDQDLVGLTLVELDLMAVI
ncbi:hypothetical protein TNCV_1085451 [Trichonephila clavipes]|nr:hypothetical protein TNCV_1085451 [Trichonephila clavipes]